jgi:hypothetical protein
MTINVVEVLDLDDVELAINQIGMIVNKLYLYVKQNPQKT